MIEQQPGEPRHKYLMRVAAAYIRKYNAEEGKIDYDETTCGGDCLAEELMIEVEMIPNDGE